MLIRFYKPFGVMPRFRDPDRPSLGDYVDVPGVYPAGRLDRDSEGLMLLTDDGRLQARIAHPRYRQPKTYWVQVEGRPTADEVGAVADRVRRGVPLKDGIARAEALHALPHVELPARNPPVTPHRAARSSWLEVVLTSGRNRLVRRMLAAVGLPVLRLHRARVGPVNLAGLRPGQWEEIPVPAEWLDGNGAESRSGDRSHGGRGRAVRRRRADRPSR